MSRNVTAGLDGSPESLAAAEWAAGEAQLREVPLRLVHSEESPPAAAVRLAAPQERRRWADTMLIDTAGHLQRTHPGLTITTRRLPGRPAEDLPAAAGDADMLVLGSRGLSGLMGFLVGSAGMHTIAATEQPVVLVRAPKEPGEEPVSVPPGVFREVVVGVDIHQSCDEVLAFAFDEAERRGCALRAVYAWILAPVLSYDPLLDPGVQLEVGRGIERTLGDMLAPWRGRHPGVKVVETALIGAPAQQLLHFAADADLVVVGRLIRTALMGAHIGPVAHAVIHHCAAPVAVVAHN
ncbi:universal stress protein [Streptomyces sp. NPDC057445]|uniref:universal stress protein n=1 Tax=Streptomyces sp. NPDC057445 TaxID=3346136 RepID=UPI0036BBCF7C